MTKEEFVSQLQESFELNGRWYSFQTLPQKVKVPKKIDKSGYANLLYSYAFKITDTTVYYIFRKTIKTWDRGYFEAKGRLSLRRLADFGSVSDLVADIMKKIEF